MSAPREILDLVARFEQQLEAYKSGQYNETQLRREFLDPFFKALGWDIDNEQGYAEAYKDVIHEDAIRMGSATKAPDYCFRIGGARKFFLEAKKPSVDIKQDISPAHQLRSYGWSAKLPLSILGDFEELAVYDCRIKPHKDDPASLGRIFYCTFHEYAEKWDWIASIFSRDAVLKGSFDKFAESTRGKRGTTEVDAAFLAEIEGWRKELAQNLALRNTKLTQRELNFAVQRIIDRIIFLRICEDRGIEDYGRLRALVNGDRIYPRLTKLFEDADARYNSGLFHFKKEPERHEDPDELTLALDLDDKLLREILRGLYYPECPYQFSVLSADILGQVYEQFLGKIIRLTPGHRAEVDDKPEVKKAGGVYYTPTYIVDYIVRQTVGKLLDECSSRRKALTEKSGNEMSLLTSAATAEKVDARAATAILSRVAKLRILDPACGSGSFLIGAYQFLLDWHLQFYLANNPVKWAKGGKPALVQSGKGWKLTIAERKRILLANIYGVDIDTQAVEVTKLSLLLKVLEGETGQTLQTIFRLFQERALPDLGDNIRCGNSLIGPDFYQQGELPLLTDDEKYRINVFDWHTEFPRIFRRRRGDESQISSGELRETAAGELDYTVPGVPLHGSYSYKEKKGAKIAPPPPVEPEWEGGFDAVIGNPPYGFHQIHDDYVKSYFKSHFVSSESSYEHYFLFYEASLKKLRKGGCHGFIVPVTWLTIPSAASLRKLVLDNFSIESIAWLPELVFKNAQVNTLVSIIRYAKPGMTRVLISEANNPALGKGVAAELPQSKFVSDGHVIRIFESKPESSLLERIESRCIPLGSIARPCSGYNPYEVGAGQAPNGKTHSQETVETRPYHSETKRGQDWKPEVIGRNLGRYSLKWPKHRFVKYGPGLAAARDPNNFVGPRLLVQEITGGNERRIIATFCKDELYYSRDVIPVKCEASWPSPLFLLGIINSWLITWRHHRRSPKAKKALFPKVLVGDLKQIPIPKLSLTCSEDKSAHDRMVKPVEQMLELHRKLAVVRTPQEKTALERQIAATDTQIDTLVYQLYGLTAEEIKIVESSAK